MWIDLCLHCTQFRLCQIVLIASDLFDLPFQLVCHDIRLLGQSAQLSYIQFHNAVSQIAGSQAAYVLLQFQD